MFHRLVLLSEGKVYPNLDAMQLFFFFSSLFFICDKLFYQQVAYHGVPEKAYEVFVTALKTHCLKKGLVIPELEDQNPAGQ